ncbi:hypothetical protein [Lysinibacillus sp. RC79]|uniref:hypothetical protein n=1 Tax=Lysinibacillus sp. RC79 TaxID=3156296 RepID=UPI0035186975
MGKKATERQGRTTERKGEATESPSRPTDGKEGDGKLEQNDRKADVAINEINNYTELEVDYKEIKSGRSITHFEIYWSKGEVISAASANQLNEIYKYLNAIMEDTFKIIGMNDTEKRDKGLNLLTSAKEIEQEIESEEVSASRADFLITNLKNMLAQINILFVEENRKAPQFYNWLEERDE